jgi:membrane associated rhomboid family serine protease
MPSYRQLGYSFGPPLTPAVKKLIIITGAAFVLTYIPAQLFHWSAPFIWFGLTPYLVIHGFYIWQLVTYLFLHGGFFHILFNLFALWMFGADLERKWGSRQFLYYFFLTGIGAGLFNVILEPSSTIPTIGNSGAVYGILLAYGLLFPERLIYLYLLIPVKAKWFVLGMGVIEFLSSLSSPGSGIAHVAHLGGMLVGFLYLRGHGLSFSWKLRYHEWRRARLRKKFEVYMRKHEEKDRRGPWVN